MRPAVSLAIPQPCAQPWAAMTPTAASRHCAACQQTVVDFTQQSDAEILAYLARAAGAPTCGRFAAGQLAQPLQRAAPAAPAARWRAWLAAAVAVWGLREAAAVSAKAQEPVATPARYWGGPVPAVPVAPSAAPPVAKEALGVADALVASSTAAAAELPVPAAVVIRGVVTDAASGERLPGVTVLFAGTTCGISIAADGTFELPVPPELASATQVSVTVHYLGYVAQQRTLTTQAPVGAQSFRLQGDVKGFMGEVAIVPWAKKMPPAPWHPRRFYYWGKYWLTRPFRRG